MDLWWSDKRPSAAAAHNHTLPLQSGEGMPGGHQADAVNPRQFALRVYKIPWPQEAALQTFHNRALDLLVRGQPVVPDMLTSRNAPYEGAPLLQSALVLQQESYVRVQSAESRRDIHGSCQGVDGHVTFDGSKLIRGLIS